MPDSPAPQQSAFKPISELQLQLVYVYTFSTPVYFLPKSTSFPPPPPPEKKNKQQQQRQPECHFKPFFFKV